MKHAHPAIPYLGPVEDNLANAFTSAYGGTAGMFRTPYFKGLLAREMSSRGSPAQRAARAMTLVDGNLLHSEGQIRDTLYPEVLPITTVAAAWTRQQVANFTKATAIDHGVIAPRRPRRVRRNRFRLAPVANPTGMFNADPAHVAAAKQLTLDLVTEVTTTQRDKIRRIVHQSIVTGQNADIAGDRIANVVGLFPRWQNAVDNYYLGLLDSGMSKALATARAKDYADLLLGKRGIMIARTELMRAMNAGRFVGWQDLAQRDVIDGGSTLKRWQAAADACDECQTVQPVFGVDTPFDTDRGPMLIPPLHPHCRCTVTIKPVRGGANDEGADADRFTIEAYPDVAGLLDWFVGQSLT